MSSMFKKKGGLAFKPKIPSARPRPAAPATNAAVPKTVEAPIANVQDPLRNTIASRDSPRPDSLETAEPCPEPLVVSAPTTSQDAVSPEHQQQPSLAEVQSKVPDTPVVEPSTVGDIVAAITGSREELRAAGPLEFAPETERSSAPAIAQHNIAPELRDEQYTRQEPLDSAPVQTSNTDLSGDSSPVTEENTPAATPSTAPKPRARKKAPSATTQGSEGEDAETRPRKRQRKTTQDGDGTTTPKPRQRKTSTQDGAASRTRAKRARSVTPDDAESQIVDLQKLKMTDLTKDLHIGRKFSRHDELRERERQAKLKAKLKAIGGDASPDASEAPEAPEAAAATPSGDQSGKSQSATPGASSAPEPAAAAGPQFRIVDGQIIVDQSSLVMDRHARDAARRPDMETVEENDFTRLITSNSFMNTSKLKGPNIWTEEETELFYRGLRMFGTEFEMISKMFPNKQRRHVKLKFNREERHCPQRINSALIGEKTIKLDIDEYKAFTGIEFESVESIEAEQRKIQEGFEAEQKRIADEQAEIMRKKREELFADEDGNEDGTGRKKKKGKKKGKQAVRYGLNGEPILAEDS